MDATNPLTPSIRAPERLAALAGAHLLGLESDREFDRFTRLAARTLAAPVALISFIDDRSEHLYSQYGADDVRTAERAQPLKPTFCYHVVEGGEPVVLSDATSDPRTVGHPHIGGADVAAYLGIPIAVDGQAIGSFCVIDHRPRAWTPGEVEILTDLTHAVVMLIRLRQQHALAEEAQARLQTTLASIGDGVITTDVNGAISYLNPIAERLTGWSNAEAISQPIGTVFPIVHETTREPVSNPIERVLKPGGLLGPANHTTLIARDGSERPIDDSAASIHLADGKLIGSILVFRDISERREQEIQLRDAKSRLDHLLSIGSVATWTWNIAADRLIADANLARFFNVSPEDANGGKIASYIKAIHPDDVDRVNRAIAAAIESESNYDEEYRVITPGGGVRWLNARGMVERDSTGKAIMLNGVVIDSTDRRKAEETIREKERFQRLIFESVRDFSIFTADLRGTITSWNAGAEQVFGYTEAEAIGQPASMVFTPEDRAAGIPRQEIQTAVQTGRATDERWHMRKAGSRFFASGVVRSITDNAGRVIGVAKIARDITESRDAQLRLQQSEERFRTLFESIDEGFCIIQLRYAADGQPEDYRFHLINPAFKTIIKIGDPTGKLASEVLPGLDRAWHRIYAQVARTGQPTRFEMGDSSLEGRSFSIYAFRIGDPAESKVAVLFSDITHRIRNQAEREQLVEQLSDADRRKDEFLAMLAHELRNPLGAISSGVELVQRVQKPEVLAELRGMIQHQVKHLTHLIDDLLDVSRITQGKVELRQTTVELTAITRKAAELAQPQIDEKRHELTVSTPSRPVAFVADPTRVEQMLSNLLTNAAKYSEPGRAIDLSAQVEGREVVFRVRDQGYGLTAEMLPKIFGLFTQIDATLDRARGGLGIGLTLVKNLAELHGGSISATSEGKDKGSEFTLRLPIGEPVPLGVSAVAPSASLPARTAPSRHRILIIDDNRDTARMTSRLLSHQGHRMMMAHDGYEGIEAAKAFEPQAILLDIGLPGLNGYEVAAAIRNHECCRQSLFIAVSGYGEASARERSKEVGIDYHLTKPLDFDRLDEILAKISSPRRVDD